MRRLERRVLHVGMALVLASGCAAFDDPAPDGDRTPAAPREDPEARGDDPANVGAAGHAPFEPDDSQPPQGPQTLDAGQAAGVPAGRAIPSLPDASMSSPTKTCSVHDIERDLPSCDFDLDVPLEPGTECINLVLVDGSPIECNGEDGWELVNPARIRLNGKACVAVLSDATTRVELLGPCSDPPL